MKDKIMKNQAKFNEHVNGLIDLMMEDKAEMLAQSTINKAALDGLTDDEDFHAELTGCLETLLEENIPESLALELRQDLIESATEEDARKYVKDKIVRETY